MKQGFIIKYLNEGQICPDYFLLFLFSFSFIKQVQAVSVTITNFPSSISSDSFTVNVSVLGASSGTNYIRVDLYKEGTQNYFGETYNGNDWYSGSDGKQYFPITIIDSKSTASASLQARIGVPNSSDYDGQGSYKMRIRRYTSSGGQGSEDANNSAVSISINVPTLTSIPTNSPTPKPTNTPTPTVKLTNTPTVIKLISNTPTPTTINPSPDNKEVLGNATQSSNKSIEESKKENQIESTQNRNNFLPIIFILIGVVFLLACVIVFFYPNIKNYLNNRNE